MAFEGLPTREKLQSVMIMFFCATVLAACAHLDEDGNPLPPPSPSQVTDAAIVAIDGLAESAAQAVRIWEDDPGDGDDAVDKISKVRATVALLGTQIRTTIGILEALGYVRSDEQNVNLQKAMDKFNVASTAVSAESTP